jgi:MFS family permease
MLLLLTVVYAFNFLDRNVLGLLTENIKADLQLSDTQMGLLTGIAFALFYSTLGIPIARWADRGNRIFIISVTTALWSAMVIYCGMAVGYVQLLLARVGVSVGEAGCMPPAQSLIADHYSRSERPRAMSYYMIGGPISIIVGYGLSGWINEFYNWRVAFFSIGVPGIALALLVALVLREPRVTAPAARIRTARDQQVTDYAGVAHALWRQVAYRHLLVSYTLISFFSLGMAQWSPAFLMRTHGIQTGELGSWFAFIFGVGGSLGAYLGGVWAARYAPRDERLQLRAMAVSLGFIIPLYLGIYLLPNIYAAFGLMMIGAVVYCAMFGPLFAMIQGVVAPQMRAMSVAVVLLFANLIGMGLGPLAVGIISDALRPAFGIESLRIALLIWTPGFLWAAFHLMRASRHVQRDIAASQAANDGMTPTGDDLVQFADVRQS